MMEIKNLMAHACKLHAWLVVIFIGNFIVSCSNDIRVVKSFPIHEKLEGRHIASLDSLYNAYSIKKSGDNFVFSVRKEDFFLRIYDKNFRLIRTALPKGHGHGEWEAPLLTGQDININGKSYTCVLERTKASLYAVDLDGDSLETIKIEDLGKTKIQGANSVFLSAQDSSYIGAQQIKRTDLFTYHKNGDKVQLIEPQGIDPNIFSTDEFVLSQVQMTYNEEQEKVAVAYFTFPLIHIMDKNGENGITLQLDKELPQYTKETVAEAFFYNLNLCSTKNNIYVLYDNPQKKQEMSILVFDWDGQPVACYDVPRLICFVVDENNHRFIGILEDETNGVAFEFKYKNK